MAGTLHQTVTPFPEPKSPKGRTVWKYLPIDFYHATEGGMSLPRSWVQTSSSLGWKGKMTLRLRLECKDPRYGLSALWEEGQELCVPRNEAAQGTSRKTDSNQKLWAIQPHCLHITQATALCCRKTITLSFSSLGQHICKVNVETAAPTSQHWGKLNLRDSSETLHFTVKTNSSLCDELCCSWPSICFTS